MACNYCYGLFCLFRLEKRCPSCGFSYCLKCLDNKIFVKQLKANKKVCVKCAQFSPSGEVHMIPPPDYYRKTSPGGYTTSEFKFGENDRTRPENNRTRPENNNTRRWNERGFNRNRYEPDRNLPSTSQNRNGITYSTAKRASDTESENDEYYSGDLSEEWDDDDDDEPNDQDLELKRSNDLKKTHPHLYRDTQRVETQRDTRSTDEILREAIKQLKESFGDNGDKFETWNKNPRKCVLCSTEALVHCDGCQGNFCMRCFDMHTDEVCAKYQTLE